MLLQGKHILITGGSSGIGKAIALEAAKEGALLAIIARNEERLEEVKSQISRPNEHLYLSFDLVNHVELSQFLSIHLASWHKIDGFVHSAGQSATLPLRFSDSEKLMELMSTQIASGLEVARWCGAKRRIPSNGSTWVYVSSVSAIRGHGAKSLYSSVKAALGGLTRSLAVEMAPHKVRVNAILPGMVETPMTRDAVYREGDGNERIQKMHPLGLGQPEDIAHAAIFLLSEKSRWITGTEWCVDGGYSISK